MVYRKVPGHTISARESVKNQNSEMKTRRAGAVCEHIVYRVYEGQDLAAEFSYHVQDVTGDDTRRFWIDGIRLCEGHTNVLVMEDILHFIRYKCVSAGCPAIHVRLDGKNLFYLELYQKFGFYMIDQEERARTHGQISCECVLKYPVPVSREEVLEDYILRSERKRAKAPAGSI